MMKHSDYLLETKDKEIKIIYEEKRIEVYIDIVFPKASDALIEHVLKHGYYNKFFEKHLFSPLFDLNTLESKEKTIEANKILADLKKTYGNSYTYALSFTYDDGDSRFLECIPEANKKQGTSYNFYVAAAPILYKRTYDFYERFIHLDGWDDMYLCIYDGKYVHEVVPTYTGKESPCEIGSSKPTIEQLKKLEFQ